jgi:Skp family chaperone for outer membrane proteins
MGNTFYYRTTILIVKKSYIYIDKFSVMKKMVFLVALFMMSATIYSQSRGIRIAYIDMEYILQNVPDYTEAKNQLELKAQRWKQEIEVKKNEIKALKESLKNEKILLTKELLEEREEEISFLESELLDYQNKRFGPTGDLITQRSVLVKPVQDQVFSAVQDIAEVQKYDFVLDKSSDLSLIFANKRHDISDRVIRSITRASRRSQMSKKELKELEEQEREEDFIDDNPALAERQKIIEDKKAERERLVEERKAAAEQRKRDFEERRERLKQEREERKSGTVSDKSTEDGIDGGESEKNDSDSGEENKASTSENERKNIQEERKNAIEERKRQIEERKQKILDEREAARKAREEKNNSNKEEEENKND